MPLLEKENARAQSCMACKEPDTDEMVACAKCKKAIHFSCAGIDRSMEDMAFVCRLCVIAEGFVSARNLNRTLPSENRGSTSFQIDALNFQFPPRNEVQPPTEAERHADVMRMLQTMSLQFARNEERLCKLESQMKIPAEVVVPNDNEGLKSDAGECFYGDRVQGLDQFAVTMNRKHLQKLPTFSGDVRMWAYFEAIYNSTTIDGRYSETENVARLREALKPPASTLVMDLVMFGQSATAIMDELRETYGRTDRLVFVLLEELFAFPKMSSETDSRLRDFAVKVKHLVANLKALKVVGENSSQYNITKLVLKLHHSHYLKWQKRVRLLEEFCQTPTLEIFGNFLMDRVKDIPSSFTLPSDALSNVKTSNPQSSSKKFSMSHQETPSPSPSSSPSRSQPQSQSRSQSQSSTFACFKCQGAHTLRNCEEFRALQSKERSKFVSENRICHCCLSSKGHQLHKCPTLRVCNLNGCEKNHHRMLHYFHDGSSVSLAPDESVESQNSQLKPLMNHQTVDMEEVLFKIVPVRLKGKEGKVIETYAFLDDGSSLTLMDSSLVDTLGLSGEHEELELQWTKGITRKEKTLRTTVNISGINGDFETMSNVYSLENLDLPVQSNDVAQLKSKFRHLRGLPIPDLQNAVPKILIGMRHSKFLLPIQSFGGQQDEPVACRTRLGWAVYGICNDRSVISSSGVQLSIQRVAKSEVVSNREVEDVVTQVNSKLVVKRSDEKVEIIKEIELEELVRVLVRSPNMSVENQLNILSEIRLRFDAKSSREMEEFQKIDGVAKQFNLLPNTRKKLKQIEKKEKVPLKFKNSR